MSLRVSRPVVDAGEASWRRHAANNEPFPVLMNSMRLHPQAGVAMAYFHFCGSAARRPKQMQTQDRH
jgi:hypothetical protein